MIIRLLNLKLYQQHAMNLMYQEVLLMIRKKSSIYISHINYCGGNDTTVYKKIECSLYEKNNNTNIIISSYKSNSKEITLEEYLKDVELNIDNYIKTCKYYNNNSLYLEINATDKNNKVITYKIPLKLKNNCSK